MKGQIRTLEISELDLGTQVRLGLNPQTVSEYAEADKAGEEFPPITVFDDGKVKRVGGGFHRIAARQKNGHKTVRAEVLAGGRREAVRFGCQDNTRHGLRMTTADKEHAVRMYNEEFPQSPVNEVAKACGVSWAFADKILNPTEYKPDGRAKKSGQQTSESNGPAPLAREADRQQPGSVSSPPPASKEVPAREASNKLDEPERLIRDGRGRSVPAHLRDVFGSTWHDDAINSLGTLATQIESVLKWDSFLEPDVLDDLAKVQDKVAASKPFCVCPHCKGADGGCASCRTGGFVTENVERNLD